MGMKGHYWPSRLAPKITQSPLLVACTFWDTALITTETESVRAELSDGIHVRWDTGLVVLLWDTANMYIAPGTVHQ